MIQAPLIHRAYRFSAQRHRGQRRKGDGQPFIVHPVAVAKSLARVGMPQEVVAAGLLHDLLEDTDTRPEEIRRRFGSRVAQMVLDVTERDKGIPWEERKIVYLAHLKCASRGALAISCADKIHNAQSLLTAYRRQGPVVFTHFSRSLPQRIANDWQVYETIRSSWSDCPLLPELKKSLRKLQRVARRHPQVSPFTEVEAKFRVKSKALHRAVGQLKRLGEFRVIRRRRERQINSYLDTDRLDLKKARVALKLRESSPVGTPRAAPKAEVTFKSELGFSRGVSRRREVTVPIRKIQIPLLLEGKLDLQPVRRARAICGVKPLRKRLTLVTDRRRLTLRLGNEEVEMDVDTVTVRKGRFLAGTFREVELENISASAVSFKGALDALKERFGKGLRPSRVWKAEYGFRLLALRAPS